MTSALTNLRGVFKACLIQTEQVSDDITRKIGPLDFTFVNPIFSTWYLNKQNLKIFYSKIL